MSRVEARPPRPSACATARRAIETRDFRGWTGIPKRCEATELFDGVQELLLDPDKQRLGEADIDVHMVHLDLPGYHRASARFRIDGRLLLFDAGNPRLPGGMTPLLEDLGKPDARLDWDNGYRGFPAGEWVYPRRGITLFIDPRPRGQVRHIALYRPTTLRNYRRTLRVEFWAKDTCDHLD